MSPRPHARLRHAGSLAIPILLVADLIIFMAAVSVGAGDAGIIDLFRALGLCGGGMPDDSRMRIILELRLPRVALSGAVGASIGLAGLAAQSLFRNPLASPCVIGVSSGAASGAVAGALLFTGATAPMFACGVAGGFMALSALRGVANAWTDGDPKTLLLAGVAFNAFFSALTSIALFVSGERLQGVLFWLMGGFWRASWGSAALLAVAAVLSFLALRAMASSMNQLLFGEQAASAVGVDVRRLMRTQLLLVAALSSLAVSAAGVIGFVGLIVPHLARLALGSDHRSLVWACALGGAGLAVLSDLAARTLASPAEMPVGIVTSLIGAPFLLWLVVRRKGRGGAT